MVESRIEAHAYEAYDICGYYFNYYTYLVKGAARYCKSKMDSRIELRANYIHCLLGGLYRCSG